MVYTTFAFFFGEEQSSITFLAPKILVYLGKATESLDCFFLPSFFACELGKERRVFGIGKAFFCICFLYSAKFLVFFLQSSSYKERFFVFFVYSEQQDTDLLIGREVLRIPYFYANTFPLLTCTILG